MDHADIVSRCYHRWFDALMAGDAAPFVDLLADDFCYVDIFGEIRDRAGYLAPCWARSPPALSP